MKSRSRIFAVVVAAALVSACGGNYSNEDLAYLNALPHREDLQSKVPDNATGTSSSGLQQRKDGLAVGDLSTAYRDTHGASLLFNGMLDFFLNIVDTIRKLPPTKRTATSRTWGPWKDDKHPAFEFQMVMERSGENFTWHIDFRPRVPLNAEWKNVLFGDFVATGGVRRGKGHLHMSGHTLRSMGLQGPNDDGKLDQLDVTYATDELPITVDMQLQGEPTSDWKTIDYSYREFDGGTGSMWFSSGSDGGSFDVRSGWVADHSGRANIVLHLNAGDGGTTSGAECWDRDFRVTYFDQPWGAGEGGDAGACPTPAGI